MSGGGGGGRGPAAGPVPASARKLVQGLKEIVSRSDSEIYAALRDCGMDPDEAVSRLLSQDTFQEVKNKRDKKKEVNKGTPEPRSRGTNNSNSRAARVGTDRTNRSSSARSVSGGVDNVASRSSILGPGVPSTNSAQKPTVPSSFANNDVVPDGLCGASQSSSGFQQNWCGVPGQMSMADIVKMGRPQGRSSSKSAATADKAFAGQNPSLSNEKNHNTKQSASTVAPTTFDQGFPALPDPIPQVINSNHASADSHQTHENVWFTQDGPPSQNQFTAPGPSGGPLSFVASLESSVLVADAVNLHEKSHTEDNASIVKQTSIPSERHSEVLHDKVQFGDELLQNSSTYQSQMHSFADEVEVSNVDVDSAATNFQHLSLQKEDQAAANSADDNPAVIIPDHLQLENTDCAHLSFGSFESGAFSGLLPSKVPKYSMEEVPNSDETPAVDQIDIRNQDYYDNGALQSSANEDVETRIGTDIENIDAPSVSQPDILMQGALDVSGLQYNPPSVSDHVYPNTTQPSIMESQQGNAQAQHLSHFSSLLAQQANTLQSNFLGSNLTQHRDFDFSPFLSAQSAMKYNPAVPTTSYPISMQENLNQGGFSNTQSTQNPPSTSIPSGLPQPQQLSLHPYSQPTLPLGPFASLVGYPYLPQNYYVPPAAFQQAYSSNGPFHQSGGAAVPGSAMKYSMPQYKSGLPVTSPPQHSSAVSGYGGFGSSSNIPNFGQNQSASPATTMGIDEALSSQFKEANHYMALQQVKGATFFRLAFEILAYLFCTTEDLLISFWGVHLWLFSERQLSDVASWSCWFKSCFSCSTW
uniref:GBF-interacting protein 1 N-terminal domain-containing protein n=2 Tax=Aegilops tauschii subsp. strangulata TaxID=200361 RepID=A0A453F6H5_AEGTS